MAYGCGHSSVFLLACRVNLACKLLAWLPEGTKFCEQGYRGLLRKPHHDSNKLFKLGCSSKPCKHTHCKNLLKWWWGFLLAYGYGHSSIFLPACPANTACKILVYGSLHTPSPHPMRSSAAASKDIPPLVGHRHGEVRHVQLRQCILGTRALRSTWYDGATCSQS